MSISLSLSLYILCIYCICIERERERDTCIHMQAHTRCEPLRKGTVAGVLTVDFRKFIVFFWAETLAH